MKKDDLYIHEDQYKLILILPNEEDFNITGNGITEVVDFQLFKNTNIESKKINVKDFKKVIKKYNSYEEKNVYMGYASSYEIKENTIAYIFDRIAIFCESNTSEIIKNIWLYTTVPSSEITIEDLFSFLHEIGNMYNLILVDYESNYVISLSSLQAIQEYFKEIFDLG